jgi:hypothetical protein
MLPLQRTWPLLLVAALCPLAAGARSGQAHAFAACGIAGARTVASSGPLAVVTTPANDVEACIGRRPPWQLDSLNGVDGPCRVLHARAARGHVAAIHIRCEVTVLDERVDEIVSFDVARRRILRGNPDAVYEHVSGVVLAADGAFALIEDFPARSDVIGCDATARCRDEAGLPARRLDQARRGSLHGLRVRGRTVSWRHGAHRRQAILR